MTRPAQSRRSPRGIALPVVLVIVVLISVGVSAVFIMMQSGVRRTSKIRGDTEHLYLSEAVLANLVNRLKMTSWENRFYAVDKVPPCHEIIAGSYRNADYVSVVEDVVDVTGTLRPNLTDILLRVTYRDTIRSFFARVSVTQPSVLRPTNVNVVRFTAVDVDVENVSDRQTLQQLINAEEEARREAEAQARILAAEAALSAKDTTRSAEAVRNEVSSKSLSGAIETEKKILEAEEEARKLLESDEEDKYAQAQTAWKNALDLAATQAPHHKIRNAPRALMGLASAKVGQFERGMTALDDPMANPLDDPTLKALLQEAMALLDELLADHAGSEAAPYALFKQAKILVKLGDRAGAKLKLKKLEEDFPDVHLWGEDLAVKGDSAKDGLVSFEDTLLDDDGNYVLDKAEGRENTEVYFEDGDGNRVAITEDDRPKDLLTVSPDGSRISYRAKNDDGSFSVVVVDHDGEKVLDVTEKDGEWEPVWKPIVQELAEQAQAEDYPKGTDPDAPMDFSALPAMNTTTNTVNGLILHAKALETLLDSDPYNVNDWKLSHADRKIDRADDYVERIDSTPTTDKKEKYLGKALVNIVDTIVYLETAQAAIDAGEGDYWQIDHHKGDDD